MYSVESESAQGFMLTNVYCLFTDEEKGAINAGEIEVHRPPSPFQDSPPGPVKEPMESPSHAFAQGRFHCVLLFLVIKLSDGNMLRRIL